MRGAPLARCSAGEGEGPRSPARINGAPLKSASRSGPELRLNRTVPLAVLAQGRTLNASQSRDCIVPDRHRCFTRAAELFCISQDSFRSLLFNENSLSTFGVSSLPSKLCAVGYWLSVLVIDLVTYLNGS